MRSDSSALHHGIGVGAKDGQRQKEKNSHQLWANTAKEWLVSLAPQINLGSWSVAYLSMKVHVDKALVDVSFKGEKEFSKRRTADHKSFVKNVVFLFILFPSTKEREGEVSVGVGHCRTDTKYIVGWKVVSCYAQLICLEVCTQHTIQCTHTHSLALELRKLQQERHKVGNGE